MPYSNEVGLQMLTGGAAREATVLGYHITPLFLYYAYHGPIFRVLLRLNRGKIHDSRHYGYIGYCHKCGNSHEYSRDQLGQISCSCSMPMGNCHERKMKYDTSSDSNSYNASLLLEAWRPISMGHKRRDLSQLNLEQTLPRFNI
ncbi:uncharacterized protein LOC107639678 [Arachis ipaensis]|uniref:uncharacterized protein LOC107639678 n=1 Tax=Arachis ipaensis TaxID=130454 RepID=UPI000A2B04A1|nr:uncharacterized protein LOC107639678 [Arachis ipaensis]